MPRTPTSEAGFLYSLLEELGVDLSAANQCCCISPHLRDPAPRTCRKAPFHVKRNEPNSIGSALRRVQQILLTRISPINRKSFAVNAGSVWTSLNLLDIACAPLCTLQLPCQPSELPLSGFTLTGAMRCACIPFHVKQCERSRIRSDSQFDVEHSNRDI